MNRTYRTVWSSVRNAYVVASEKAKSRGKPSSTRTAVASAVALALTALAAPQALAVTSCGPATVTITAPNVETACTLAAGDSLTVNAGATIQDSAAAPVDATAGAASLNNAGTIQFNYVPVNNVWGTGTGAFTTSSGWGGIWSPAVKGSFTTITNSGTIAGAVHLTSGDDGLLLTGTSGTLTNTGTISGGNRAIVIGTPSTSTWSGPTLINSPAVVGTLTSLTNSGIISGGAGAGLELATGSSIGSLNNQAGGTISGGSRGILVTAGAVDSFVNAGTISGTATGWAGGIGVEFGTAWTGTGSSGTAIGSTLSGGLTNTGTISGTNGGVLLDGVTVGSAGTPAHITNSGSITSPGGVALRVTNSTLHGNIINQAGGTIAYTGTGSGTSIGISVGSSTLGSITNSGTIGGGIVVKTNSALSGSLTNASGGVITASNWAGLYVNSSTVGGAVLNAGSITITGRTAGISISGNATVTGAVSNTGTINFAGSSSSSAAGISVSNATVGSISNSGTIDAGGGVGMNLGGGIATIAGDITNTVNGVIRSMGSSSSTSGAWHWGTGMSLGTLSVGGSLINHGTIEGGNSGLVIGNANITGGINNSGSIIGLSRYAVEIGGMSATTLGALVNSGTISGGSVGVQIGNTITRNNNDLHTLNNSGTIEAAGTGSGFFNGYGIHLYFATLDSITNSGVISGSLKSIYVNKVTNGSTSVLTNLFIDGNNTAQFNGMVDAPDTAVSILNGATYTLRGTDDFRVASFTNNGTAQFAAGATNFTLANVTGNTFTNNGVLAVAAGGTGTLTGNYTQAANATLRIGASDNTTYGKLVVTGTATLPSNAKIDVNVSNANFAFTTTAMADILSAGTLTSDGTFVVTDNSALFDFTASKDVNTVDLALAATSTVNTTNAFNNVNSPAGARAAAVIDNLVADYIANGTTGNAGMDAVLAQLGTYTTDAELVAAVMQTVPQVGAAMKRVSAAVRASVTSALAARIRAASGQSSGDGFVTDGNAWFKPLGAWAKQDDNGGVSGYKANTYGFVAGADGELASGARIGAALGVTRTTVDGNGGLQSAKVTGYQAALYGSMDAAGDYLVDWQADVGYNQNTGTRRIAFMSTTAGSDYTGTSVHLGAGVSRDLTLAGGDVLTPSLRADYTHLRDQSYTETGAGALNLTVDGQTFHELLLVADGMWTRRLDSGASLSANLGVAYDAHAKQDDLTSAYAGGGAAFGTSGIQPSATTVRGGVGYSMPTGSGMQVDLRYDVEGRSGYTAQSVSAKLAMPF